VSVGTALGTAAAHRALTIQPLHDACLPIATENRFEARVRLFVPDRGSAGSYCIAAEAGSPEPLMSENGRHTSKSQVVPPHIGQRGGSLDAAAP